MNKFCVNSGLKWFLAALALCLATMPSPVFALVQGGVVVDMAPNSTDVLPDTIYVEHTGKELVELTGTVSGQARIQFIDNKTSFDSTLANNRRELEQMRKSISDVQNDRRVRVTRYRLKGYASPEGSWKNNVRLAKGRMERMRLFMVDEWGVDPSLIETGYEPEDWQGMRDYVVSHRDAFRAADSILAVIDSDMEPDPKLAKIAEEHREDYKKLRRECFPQLRRTEYHIDYDWVDMVERQGRTTYDTIVNLRLLKPERPLKADICSDYQPTRLWLEPKTDQFPDMAALFPKSEIAEVPDSQLIPRRELLSVKTNLLFYAAYIPGYDRWCPIPNVAVEYYPKGGHFTFGASFDMPWWQHYSKHKFFQLRNYQLETRYYLKAHDAHKAYKPHKPHEPHEPYKPHPSYSGLYLQAYANAGLFGICFDADRGWVGEGFGGGLGLGYVMPVSKSGHWRLEFGLQAGFFRCKYDPYQYENPVDLAYHDDLYYYKWTLDASLFKKRQYRWNWLGPTRIGVTLTYDLLYRRISKKGVSFKAYEPHEPHKPYKPHNPQKERRPAHE